MSDGGHELGFWVSPPDLEFGPPAVSGISISCALLQ